MTPVTTAEYTLICDLLATGFYKTQPRNGFPCVDHIVVVNGVPLAHPVAASTAQGWATYCIAGRAVTSWGRVLVLPKALYESLRPATLYENPPPYSHKSARCRKPRDRIEQLMFDPYCDHEYLPAEVCDWI